MDECSHPLQNGVEDLEAGRVLPAVHIGGEDRSGFLELLNHIEGESCLARSGRAEQEGVPWGEGAQNRIQAIAHSFELAVPVDNPGGNKLLLQNPEILDNPVFLHTQLDDLEQLSLVVILSIGIIEIPV